MMRRDVSLVFKKVEFQSLLRMSDQAHGGTCSTVVGRAGGPVGGSDGCLSVGVSPAGLRNLQPAAGASLSSQMEGRQYRTSGCWPGGP